MNIILFEKKEISSLAGSYISLSDDRAKHMVKVLRSERGDWVKVGIIDGVQGRAKLIDIKTKYPFEVQLELFWEDEVTEKIPVIDLVLALPRPIMLRRILSQATTLGVGNIHLIGANRVEKSFWQASLLEEVEYREHLRIGLEQGVATLMPKVHIHKYFKSFVEDYLPQIENQYSHKVLADPSGNSTIFKLYADREAPPHSRTLLAVGPEGGWVDFELEKFKEQGFNICTMGKRILKVDTAVIALHSRISTMLEELGV